MTGQWTIDMPITDTVKRALLSANERAHWSRRAKVTGLWREQAFWYAKAANVPALGRAHIEIHVCFGDRRRRDVGNYQPTAKAIVDGLVDAGVLRDDRDEFLEGPDLRRLDGRVPLVRVVVTELPGQAALPLGDVEWDASRLARRVVDAELPGDVA